MGKKQVKQVISSLLIIALMATSASFYGCGSDSDGSDSVQSQIVQVTRGSLRTTISSLGTISLPDQVKLTFGSAGTVIELMVKEGDTVEKGQSLARLDSASLASLEKAFVQATINLQNAQETLEDARNPYDEADIAQAEANVASARIALETAIEDLADVLNPYTKAQMAEAKADVAELRFALFKAQQQATDDIDDAEEMFTKARSNFMNSIIYIMYKSERYYELMEEWEEAQLTYDAMVLSIEELVSGAEDSLANAQETLAEMTADENPLEVEKKEKELIIAHANLADAQETLAEIMAGGDTAEIRLRELEVIGAQDALQDAQKKLEAVDMVAPFDGIVSAVNVDLGDDVTANQDIIHLVNPNVVEVDASVDEIDVAMVKQGLTAIITVDALPNAMLRGEVASVAMLASSQSGVVTYDLVIEVMNAEGVGLKEGMSATIEIVSIQAEDVLLVPAQAISRSGRNQVVQVVTTTGETEERTVETGETNGTMTEITSGLTEGEQVKVTASSSTSTTGNQFFPGGGVFPGGFPEGGFPGGGAFRSRD